MGNHNAYTARLAYIFTKSADKRRMTLGNGGTLAALRYIEIQFTVNKAAWVLKKEKKERVFI